MTEVWIEHPDRPGSRQKVTVDALNTRYVFSGWRESTDQSDPEPAPAPVDDPAGESAADTEPEQAPDSDADDLDTPKKKGRS